MNKKRVTPKRERLTIYLSEETATLVRVNAAKWKTQMSLIIEAAVVAYWRDLKRVGKR